MDSKQLTVEQAEYAVKYRVSNVATGWAVRAIASPVWTECQVLREELRRRVLSVGAVAVYLGIKEADGSKTSDR